MKAYDANAPLASLHIPKTGGASFHHVLEGWFPEGRLFIHYRPLEGRGLPLRQSLSGGTCVHGHFNAARGFGVDEYYPQIDQFITFAREPFERFVSLWLYFSMRLRAGAILRLEPDFPSFLHARVNEQMQGGNSESMIWQLPKRPDDMTVGKLFDRRFVFVGIMERYQQSIDMLAARLGKATTAIDHFNMSERSTEDFSGWRAHFEKHFSAEYELYEAALACNAELIRQHTS
jgi:hypothetical protein